MRPDELDRFEQDLQERWELEEAERKMMASAARRLHPVWLWGTLGFLLAAASFYFLKAKGYL